MGVFSRFMDIVNSNINAILDKAEDPEKMLRLMLQEVEDTIIELKASCAANIANQTRVKRLTKEYKESADKWFKRAELALENENEQLAKEALLERRRVLEQIDSLEAEEKHYNELSAKCKSDIEKLEEKLESLRVKHKAMREKSFQAAKKESTSTYEDPLRKFEEMEGQIDRMSERESYYAAQSDLEARFASLEEEKAIEEELNELRLKKQKG